eukprot:4426900-Pleurochrysis_carterae.AAC.1
MTRIDMTRIDMTRIHAREQESVDARSLATHGPSAVTTLHRNGTSCKMCDSSPFGYVQIRLSGYSGILVLRY